MRELLYLVIVLLPRVVVGGCRDIGKKENEEKSKLEVFEYKICAITLILVASIIGVCLPIVGKMISTLRFNNNNVFFIIKGFAAGAILATGFIHILPDAFESLSSSCIGDNAWNHFPFPGFIAMLSAIATLMLDTCATSYYTRSLFNKTHPLNSNDDEKNDKIGAHDSVIDDYFQSQFFRHRVISPVLKLGILVHSVIIGISLGASQTLKTIKSLSVALVFHQCFEGIGFGGCIAQAKFKPRVVAIMTVLFSVTTPVGIIIGVFISNVYNENSRIALIVEGILNSASAGVLIYMALVDLLATDFVIPEIQRNRRLQFVVHLSLLSGAASMSFLSIWIWLFDHFRLFEVDVATKLGVAVCGANSEIFLFFEISFMGKSEIACVTFSGKELWGHIDGTSVKPTDPAMVAD
ncbi:zinc transporter 3-like [Mercurialis annua]|uniref:zinc transporter 3-like n=1 Tax=Mercurialis annua TaxID=3986 RepID=UPI00215F31BD|nr:zinc transporter 3-like [Mercurialis annua]